MRRILIGFLSLYLLAMLTGNSSAAAFADHAIFIGVIAIGYAVLMKVEAVFDLKSGQAYVKRRNLFISQQKDFKIADIQDISVRRAKGGSYVGSAVFVDLKDSEGVCVTTSDAGLNPERQVGEALSQLKSYLSMG